ncbi:hypothetical protein Paes_0971 [Prosthecochloris aestuarii DSM 271]|uniref:Uncharacterized protein n=1 Tax=Prosthecochloris aestuarii (strain DSM 271 / SK 413) TaxID=290512 RepID=B4S7H6_PROA2|nr:hypothetical protein Paes_0971 [Prosthecochloris aestuarii DSM 271]
MADAITSALLLIDWIERRFMQATPARGPLFEGFSNTFSSGSDLLPELARKKWTH